MAKEALCAFREAFELLTGKIALAEWDGAAWGPEYLTFDKGAVLLPEPAPTGVDPVGWGYARVGTGRPGWYPPSWATPSRGAPCRGAV